MRFEFVAKHRGIWPVSWICEALGVSRSGFHAWLVRAPSAGARSDEAFGARVRASFISSYRTYGARRVWHDLLAEGLSCGLHRIGRLMRVHGLKARPRRRGLPKDDGLRSVIADNLLDRQFTAEAPNQRWIADFTYIWTAEGWLYVAVVIDLFSRRVVGWSMSDTMAAQLVTDALMMAIWRRGKPDALLHHSDQGSQYTSEKFQRLMADNGVTCSMSRSGNVWDNAAMESFFSSLKTERIGRKTYRTRNHAKADVFDYIERFYNPTRRHSTLGYLSPMDFERQAQVAYLVSIGPAAAQSTRWRSRLKWLWTLAWTEANFRNVRICRNRSIARSRRRNDRWLFSTRVLASGPTSCLSRQPKRAQGNRIARRPGHVRRRLRSGRRRSCAVHRW